MAKDYFGKNGLRQLITNISRALDLKVNKADSITEEETHAMWDEIQGQNIPILQGSYLEGHQHPVFAVTFKVADWEATTVDGNNAFVQMAECPGMKEAYILDAPQVVTTGVKETDEALKEALDTLCEAGNSGETLDGYIKWTCYGDKPSADLPLRFHRAVMPDDPETNTGTELHPPFDGGDEVSE